MTMFYITLIVTLLVAFALLLVVDYLNHKYADCWQCAVVTVVAVLFINLLVVSIAKWMS